MLIALFALGAVGHAILWVALVNRIHALGIARHWISLLTALCGLAMVLVPLAVWLAAAAAALGISPPPPAIFAFLAWAYVAACVLITVWAAAQRWHWRRHPERCGALVSNHTTCLDLGCEPAEPLLAPGVVRLLGRVPGNQVTRPCVQEKHLVLPDLPAAAEGLRIAHLTDLHMSGRITRAYFERVVEEVNRREADLIAITGDIVERAPCLDWIPTTLGRLKAAGGVYFVLGNHDRDAGPEQIIAALQDAGLIYLGGSWREIQVRGALIRVAGNELPWFRPAADLSGCPASDAALPLKVLLAHSPDQFRWAQQQGFDLMLAGHNHGGQFCLPILGPITAPSLHGVRYAAGTFREGATVLHVSRGVSSLTPLRFNCPPEIAVLNLRSKAAS